MEFFSLRATFAEYLDALRDERLAVFLELLFQAEAQGTVTNQSLARAVGRSAAVVAEALRWLQKPTSADDKELPALIKVTDKYVTIPKTITGKPTHSKIPYSKEEDTEARVAALEKELKRLHRRVVQLEANDESGLVEVLSPEEAEAVQFAEELEGRALTTIDAFFVGKAISSFGPDRFVEALQKRGKSKQPVRAAIKFLYNEGLGKPARKREAAKIHYAEWNGQWE